MADYPISNVPRRVQYVNSGVGPYAFAFAVLVQTDIAVYRGNTLLTLTTDYSVIINANGTGSITLVTAGTGNITIVGARAIQRTSDYTTGGDLFASTLNVDLDSQTIFSQQLAESISRTVAVPVTDASTLDMQLPTSASRANKLFGFSSTGSPAVSTNTIAAVDAAVDTITSIAGAPAGSSAGISHIASGIGAVPTTVQSKLRDFPASSDFGTEGSNDAVTAALAATAAPIFITKNLLGGVQYATDARSKKLRTIAGVIRQTAPDGGWQFITPTHDKLGFSGTITVDGNGDLVINFNFTANNVISFIAVPDEFYASQGLKIGSSVGTTSVRLEAFADMSAIITTTGVAYNGSLGLSDVVSETFDAATGVVTFSHPAVYTFGSSKASSVLISPANGTNTKEYGGTYFVSDYSPTDFTVKRLTPLSGVVTVAAGVPTLTTLCLGMSVDWDATNTCFVITHPSVVSTDRTPIVGGMIRNPTTDTPYFYLAEFTSSATEIRVHVYDGITGAKITTNTDNSMRFSFERPNTYLPRPISATDNTQCQVFRPNMPLNFNKIFANTGNIWLYGVMEQA
jgi:hypothetical protein